APRLAQGGVDDAPEALDTLIARCLEKDRERRPATIDHVRATLDRLAEDMPWTETDALAWWDSRAAALGIADRLD
ncbi:MAG: hypothetical protein ABIR98_09275, partial [Usitatibacter sp.]